VIFSANNFSERTRYVNLSTSVDGHYDTDFILVSFTFQIDNAKFQNFQKFRNLVLSHWE